MSEELKVGDKVRLLEHHYEKVKNYFKSWHHDETTGEKFCSSIHEVVETSGNRFDVLNVKIDYIFNGAKLNDWFFAHLFEKANKSANFILSCD